MDSKQFLQEVLESDQCPQDFERRYAKFQEYQNMLMDALREFHRICEKRGIEYQLAYGSLLGAVRDHGQIPWDYDVDVWVPYYERERLVEALNAELDEKYFFQSLEVNKKARHYMLCIAPQGYRAETVHLDVFFLFGLSKDTQTAQAEVKRVHVLADIRYYRYLNILEESFVKQNKLRKLTGYTYHRLQSFRVPMRTVDREIREICSRNPLREAEKCAVLCVDVESSTYETNEMLETELLETDEGAFRVSKNYEAILKKIYGDYTQVPPLSGRLKEFEYSFQRLEFFRKYG